MAKRKPDTPETLAGDYKTVFLVEVAYLVALFALAILYVTNLYKLFPVTVPQTFGTVSIGVPWFGALGAVMISLTGLFDHPSDWKVHLKYWHFSRPLIGAALGIIAVLTFQAGVLAVGSPITPAPTVTSATNLLYYLIAFIVGYREEIFRELIKRLGDVIFTPGDGTAPATPSVVPALPSSASPVQASPVNEHVKDGHAITSESVIVATAGKSDHRGAASHQADAASQADGISASAPPES